MPRLPSNFATTGHDLLGFQEKLVGAGPMCDANYTVTFTRYTVTIYSPTENPIITCWREATVPRLWYMYLLPTTEDIPQSSSSPNVHKISLQAFSAHDLPGVEALVRYFHAASGLPVRDIWLKAIKAGKFTSWTVLTYQNTAKYYPISNETLNSHMVQLLQGVRSTNPKPSQSKFNTILKATDLPIAAKPPNELYIIFEHIRKFYTDDTDRFPVRPHSGNQYRIIVHHCDSDDIIAVPFESCANKHRLLD